MQKVIERGTFALVTQDKDGKEDIKVLSKTLNSGCNSKVVPMDDHQEAEMMAKEAAKEFEKVWLVRVYAVFEAEVKDLLE